MMISKFRTAFADESGQGMTEYIIIVALIAIAAIGVVTVFGNNIRQLFGNSVDALAGNNATNSGGGLTKSNKSTAGHKHLNDFGNKARVK